MENSLNDADRMIDLIDQNLLNLYDASQNKTAYQFFDFFEALIILNEYVLKDGEHKDYFNLKASRFRSIFDDLLFFKSELKYKEFLNTDPEKGMVKFRITTQAGYEVNAQEYTEEIPFIDDQQYANFLKNVDLKKGQPEYLNSTIKYNYLLRRCQIHGKPVGWMHNFQKGFDSLFLGYNLDMKEQMTFEDYVNKLQKIESFNPSKIETGNIQINEVAQNDELTNSPQKIDIGSLKSKRNKPEIRPMFHPDAIAEIWNLFKCYFNNDDWNQLLEVLKTGKTPDKKLFFMGYAKTLLDAFKQLLVGQFVSIPVQDDYAKWISNVFEFSHRGERKQGKRI